MAAKVTKKYIDTKNSRFLDNRK